VGDSKVMKVTSVQLAFTGLETAESGQRSIEGFFTTTPDRGQLQGSSSAARSVLKRPRDAEDTHDDALPQMELPECEASTIPFDGSTSFDCPRCGKRVTLAEQFVGETVEKTVRAQALDALRVEHDDFHFAQDLAKTSNTPQSGRQWETKKKKKKSEPEGIAKFFSKK
jgi:DNA polymerase eta